MALHGGENRGPMLTVGYWYEAGCQGRIELREHKGNVFLSLRAHALTGEEAQPRVDSFTMPAGSLAPRVPQLRAALGRLGAVGRVRNPSLWDALVTAIIRQVIRAGQARKLYRVFCDAYGARVVLPGEGWYPLTRAGGGCGTGRRAVRVDQDGLQDPAAARRRWRFLDHGDSWQALTIADVERLFRQASVDISQLRDIGPAA
jgi:hypothetical protein